MTATTSATRNAAPNGIARILPILQWARQYDRNWLSSDLIAGLTVAALVVPKSLGYAGIAGVPIQYGLYAAAAGAIVYAFFGTCKQIATGPSSALAAVAAAGVAQGMTNVASGLVQGIPVSTSLSASSLNDSAGAKTPVASLTTGVLVILTLLFLAPVFSYLPKAVLAAVIIDAVVFGMMDVKEMRRLRRVKRTDFWIAVAAILGVMGAGVLAGVLIGIVLSLGWLVYVSAIPSMPVLGRQSGTQVFRSIDEFPDSETYPGLLVLRFDSGLFFASSDALEDRLRELALIADPRIDTVVLDFEGINFVDSQGSAKLSEVFELATNYGAELRLARVKAEVMTVLRADGIVDEIGAEHIYGNVYEAAADRIPETSVG